MHVEILGICTKPCQTVRGFLNTQRRKVHVYTETM